MWCAWEIISCVANYVNVMGDESLTRDWLGVLEAHTNSLTSNTGPQIKSTESVQCMVRIQPTFGRVRSGPSNAVISIFFFMHRVGTTKPLSVRHGRECNSAVVRIQNCWNLCKKRRAAHWKTSSAQKKHNQMTVFVSQCRDQSLSMEDRVMN